MSGTGGRILAAIIALTVVTFLATRPPKTDERAAQKPSGKADDKLAAIARATAPPPIPDRIPIEPKKSAASRAVVIAAVPATHTAVKVKSQPEPPELTPLVPHEVAREALAYVGVDSLAEALWVQAINDPALTKHQRSDLIEDLNEEGFPDPKNVTIQDLPLIQSRMQIIEHLASDAMDEVNYDAFAEAYKDLSNMVKKLGR